MGNHTSSILITFEYHCEGKKQYEDGAEYHDEYLVLKSVELELDPDGFNVIEVSLNDMLREHYSKLLSQHQYGLEVKEMVA